jgi:hypothetical protein
MMLLGRKNDNDVTGKDVPRIGLLGKPFMTTALVELTFSPFPKMPELIKITPTASGVVRFVSLYHSKTASSVFLLLARVPVNESEFYLCCARDRRGGAARTLLARLVSGSFNTSPASPPLASIKTGQNMAFKILSSRYKTKISANPTAGATLRLDQVLGG